MIRILFPVVLLIIAFIMARRYLKASPVGEEKSRKVTVILIGFALLMAALAVTGRLYWVGAALAALAPVGKFLLTSAIDFYRRNRLNEYVAQAEKRNPSGALTREEAIKILGLNKSFTEEDVVNAHRKLIQKLHPDRGGNDYLAAKINEARDLLLKT